MGILDSLTKNPSLLALAALGIGLFIFRDKISGFFSDITGGAKTAGILGSNLSSNLTGIQDILSGKIFEDVKLPTFELPTAQGDQGSLFGAGQAVGGFFGSITDFFGNIFNPPTEPRPPPMPGGLPVFPTDPRLTPNLGLPDLSIPVAPSIAPTVIAPFQGGGPSFEGGQIFETPIENLSLNQIIEMFGVTASQAANIRAGGLDDFGDFGFGTNLGTGIGPSGLSPREIIAGGGSIDEPGNVSDPQFSGLSPSEIFARLVGGNISNF